MIGTFSPFHKAQYQIVKQVAPYFDQIIIFVAGLKESTENPFSFDLRKKIIENSMGPMSYKTKVVPALVKKGGKIIQTGYVKSLLQKVNAMQRVDAALVIVGADRFRDYRQQLQEIQKDSKRFDKVRIINGGLRLNEYGEKISAGAIRGALLANDSAFIKRYLAPPISENPALFKEIYGEMKKEIEDAVDAQAFEKVADKSDKSKKGQ